VENTQEPKRPLGDQALSDWRVAELNDARGDLATLANRLWAGNGAGVIASTTLLLQESHGDKAWFWSPFLFLLGLVCLGVGSVLGLIYRRRLMDRLEKQDDMLGTLVSDIHGLSDRAGLTLRNPYTSSAVISAALFISGVIVSGFLVYSSIIVSYRYR
jgi:hypothetical protein